MLKDHGSALDGFAVLYDGTGNSTTRLPLRLTCHFTVEHELVVLCQSHGDRPYHGRPLGLMPELWPFDLLKRRVLKEAELFQASMGKIGYEPLEAPTAMQLWGPYMEKLDRSRLGQDYTPEADNPFIPRSEKQRAYLTYGYKGDELRFDKGCAFRINGRFLANASLVGRIEEERGVVIV